MIPHQEHRRRPTMLTTFPAAFMLCSSIAAMLVVGAADLTYEWSQIGGNVNAGTTDLSESGFHVALSGDGTTVAVGSPLVGETRGLVRVSRLKQNDATGTLVWDQLGLDIVDEDDDGHAGGFAVSLSRDGNIVAVGFPGSTDSNLINNRLRNFVKVYQWNPTSNDWEQLGSSPIFANDLIECDEDICFYSQSRAGWSVSLADNGMLLAVGAPSYYVDGVGTPGQARMYGFNETEKEWYQIGQPITGDDNYADMGYSVSLADDGTTVAVGGPHLSYLVSTQPGNGSVQVWRLNSTEDGWEQVGSTIVGQEPSDQAGYSVALSNGGELLAMGIPGVFSGMVRVYKFNNESDGDWEQVGSDILTDKDSDWCWGLGCFGDGRSIDLSGDGDTLAVASPAQAINGVIFGLARVFRHNGTDWEKVGASIAGEDRFGEDSNVGFVSLSSDGNRVVVGAPLHCEDSSDYGTCASEPASQNENWDGHVRVFDLVELAPTSSTPTASPTTAPTTTPTMIPTKVPSKDPPTTPILAPTLSPSSHATKIPTDFPTGQTAAPSTSPTSFPTKPDTSGTIGQFGGWISIATATLMLSLFL